MAMVAQVLQALEVQQYQRQEQRLNQTLPDYKELLELVVVVDSETVSVITKSGIRGKGDSESSDNHNT